MKPLRCMWNWLAVVGTVAIWAGSIVGASKPNVLFLAVDDMRDWVGCLGGYPGKVHTPNIDQLAATGMLFSNAHCPSPKCGPSRAAILTGLRPSTTGLYDNGHWWFPNRPDTTTLPLQFRKHGYQVVGSGKIFHHTAGNNPPFQWHAYHRLTFQNDPWFRGAKLNYPWSRHTPFPKGFPFSGVKGLPHENDWGVIPIADADHDDARSADFAINFLKENQATEKPFFLACGLFRPHLPWYVPRQFFDLYPKEDIQIPKAPEDDLKDIPPIGRQLAKSRRSDLQTIQKASKVREAIQAYLASISFADVQLGRVLNALRDSPHADNTITILWSDHGWHHGEKQHWHKSTLWETATRVPFILRTPGHKPGTCHRPVSLIDIYPTLNELCSFKPAGQLDGTSLAPLLQDPLAKWNRPAIIEYHKGNVAIRSERWRYIRYRDGGEELYDHENDSNEWNNLAKFPEHAAIKKNLARWYPIQWAPSAPTKSAFQFDPKSYAWKHRKTGREFKGKMR